jgi:hypothetical protein
MFHYFPPSNRKLNSGNEAVILLLRVIKNAITEHFTTIYYHTALRYYVLESGWRTKTSQHGNLISLNFPLKEEKVR